MAQLLSNLPNRALIKFGSHSVGSESAQPIIWMVADKNHSGYPSNSVTLITQKIIDLRAYDAQGPQDQEEYKGDIDYRLSNINAWLNSSGSASAWFTAAYNGDSPPSNEKTRYGTGYDTRPGFLYNFTQSERLALLPTTLTTQVDSNVSRSITVKVFLPSAWEILGTHLYSDGSSRFSCFTSGNVVCGLTAQAYNNTLSSSKPASVNDNWEYLTRSTNYYKVIGVSKNGESVGDYPSYGNRGVRPVINLSATTKISDTVDSDGCYTILTQTPPTISGSDSNLGVKGNYYTEESGFPTTIGFKQTYTVNDADTSDSVTVTEYIDNVKVRSYVATKNATNTFDVTGKTWLKLSNGVHTLKITATDGFDTVTRTYTFTKSVGLLVVQRTTPIDASTMPTYIIATVVKSIPEGADCKVEVCNNGFDTKPTWEEVVPGEIHKFDNIAKTAGKWGVNIRVTVKRNGTEGACYITEIGGNFK